MKTPQAEGWSRGEFLRGLTVVVTAGLLCILFCGGCTFSYQPPFAPIIFSIDENFNVTISSEATIVTSLGTISIGASFKLPKKNGTTVILRNVKLDLDKAYLIEVNHGLEAIANGKTKIIIQDKKSVN